MEFTIPLCTKLSLSIDKARYPVLPDLLWWRIRTAFSELCCMPACRFLVIRILDLSRLKKPNYSCQTEPVKTFKSFVA
jgi:hypothetical protein